MGRDRDRSRTRELSGRAEAAVGRSRPASRPSRHRRSWDRRSGPSRRGWSRRPGGRCPTSAISAASACGPPTWASHQSRRQQGIDCTLLAQIGVGPRPGRGRMAHPLGQPAGGAPTVGDAYVEPGVAGQHPTQHQRRHGERLLVGEPEPQVGVEAGQALVSPRGVDAAGGGVEEQRDVELHACLRRPRRRPGRRAVGRGRCRRRRRAARARTPHGAARRPRAVGSCIGSWASPPRRSGWRPTIAARASLWRRLNPIAVTASTWWRNVSGLGERTWRSMPQLVHLLAGAAPRP